MEQARGSAITAFEELYSGGEVGEALEALCRISLAGGSKKKWGE